MTRHVRFRPARSTAIAAALGAIVAATAASPAWAIPGRAAPARAAQAYDLRLVGPQADSSWSEDVNDRGATAGGFTSGGWVAQPGGSAALLPGTGADGTSFGQVDAPTAARKLNNAGAVIGSGWTTGDGYGNPGYVLRWPSATAAPTPVAGPFLPPFAQGNPVAINAGGSSLYTRYDRSSGWSSWLAAPGRLGTRLDSAATPAFQGSDLDDNGTAVGTARATMRNGQPVYGSVAVAFTRGTGRVLPSLPTSPGDGSDPSTVSDGASAISPDGRYIVGWSGSSPALWDHRRTVTRITNVPDGFWAVDVNRGGVVLGFVGSQPWLWAKGQATALDGVVRGVPDGMSLCLPTSINRVGQIALSLCAAGTSMPARAALLTPGG